MYLGYTTSLDWLSDVAQQVRDRPALPDPGAVRVFIIPSFPVLESAHSILGGLPVVLRAQNCASARTGMAPLLCVGEPSPRNPGAGAAFCLDQIRTAGGHGSSIPAGLMPAYEPVCAKRSSPAGAG